MRYVKDYSVIVVGAGHAGLEAALACARLGLDTLLLTLNLDTLGKMSCNPAIGGPGKSQLVREIDALGGEMGRAADATFLQRKMLNLSKGPAVQALRVQTDRAEYIRYMKRLVENTPRLDLKQAEVTELILADKVFQGVKTKMGFAYYAPAVVLTTGTFLRGEIFIGLDSAPAGRLGEFSAAALTASLNAHGIRTGRLKTGTTPRVDWRTIDFTRTREEPGLEETHFFSGETLRGLAGSPDFAARRGAQRPCYLVRTNPRAHEIIRANLDRSPLYQGLINAVGPRYCPSIEDKVMRFADKDSHHLFLEPEGVDTTEMYVQGFSTSLPYDVQLNVLRTIPGLEKVEIMRPGYAVAYDFIYPEQLDRSLRLRDLAGIFSAGQINGTSGYEEAAAQGLVAGVNAARFVCGRKPLVLCREESYIGTLIDDLITKEIREPYRMMTSRSEYRLFLRQDNAEDRLLKKGRAIGLISADRYLNFKQSQKRIRAEKARLTEFKIFPNKKNREFLLKLGEKLTKPSSGAELLKRQAISLLSLLELGFSTMLSGVEAEKLEIEIKYSAYLDEVRRQIRQAREAEKRKIPPELDYDTLLGLRNEAREKLKKIRPETVGQASRLAGVNPADISILLVWLRRQSGG
ncbi:tRNA uridine-5-carboxymethylaminomethyl(34) synthesis enzyme MnmG [Candidatus Termititenax persephonae]|uniref:tRNA uridine 5-carboxymethylaminomethyl modification enzyme MnmG n=1 Tax=Candidatus Termititenax persephonae TaxID=2218525 RepID=A0A388TJ27_9BACT|nr:tRNA uridine-5-carboxymethylaminomethyl(34) synthesis enzyme MnmG [Candidatus Termititenax persephonae]